MQSEQERFSIEGELERRAKTDGVDAAHFWHQYEVMKKYLSEEYYPWVHDKCPYFTDHGSGHIQSVKQAVESVLSGHLAPGETALSNLDLFLLLCGIIWHDVGMVAVRSHHAEKVVEITKKVKELFPGVHIQRLVEEISTAHSGETGLTVPRTEENCTLGRTYKVYPRALAAVVRLADEVSENHTRISHALIENVPEDNRIYWEYASCIEASYAEPSRERIVVEVEIQVEKASRRMKCRDFPDRTRRAAEIPLIEYALCRLEKMNNERAYCYSYLTRYADLKSVEARFTLLRETARLPDYELSVAFRDYGLSADKYPRIEIIDDFFRTNPAWTPEKIEEALR